MNIGIIVTSLLGILAQWFSRYDRS